MNDDRHENDPVERAAAALRDAPAPDGPTPELAARTLGGVRAAAATAGGRDYLWRNSTMSILLKVAAVVAVVACGVAAYVAFVRSDRVQVGPVQPTPPQQTRPSPDTAPVPPNEAVVVEQTPETDPPPAVVADGASVLGRVVFEGEPPEPREIDMSGVPQCAGLHIDVVYDESVVVGEHGELVNVVVSVSAGLPADSVYDPPAEPAVLDQRGCMYKPHVLAMMVGQEIRVRNSDPFLHNVHSLAVENEPINRGQPHIDPGLTVPSMLVPETVVVKCDVHPWMQCYWVAFDHPFFAVTGRDGVFHIRDLPPGEYTLKAWHETFGERHQQIVVEAGRPVEVTFTFKAEE